MSLTSPSWSFVFTIATLPGPIVVQSLREETRQHRPGRVVKIIDLGLNPEEARDLAERGIVEIEEVSHKTRQGVARYIDDDNADWLQTHRVELNAFTTRDFIDWLDELMEGYSGKLIPPPDVLAASLIQRLQTRLREEITNRVLAKARVEDQVRKAEAELPGCSSMNWSPTYLT